MNSKKSILIVDDDLQSLRLLATVLERGGHEPRPLNSGRLAIEAAVADPPDLVLLDVEMPEMTGIDVCRWLKQDERLRGIPVIFISGHQGVDEKVEGFRAGAADYITKPFHEQEVTARVNTHLRLRQLQLELAAHNAQLEARVAQQVKAVCASQLAIIFALAKLTETRDDATGQHVERVQLFTRMLAEQLRRRHAGTGSLDDGFIERLYQAAALHAIGKVGMPDAVLLKPGPLTAEEAVRMRDHTRLGAETLASVLERHPDNVFLRMGMEVARSHHERWDGGGYPDGLRGKEIPLAARIVSVADVYDALTSKRCYRPPLSHEESTSIILAGGGTQFDSDVVAAFGELADQFRRVRRARSDT